MLYAAPIVVAVAVVAVVAVLCYAVSLPPPPPSPLLGAALSLSLSSLLSALCVFLESGRFCQRAWRKGKRPTSGIKAGGGPGKA